MKSVISFAAIVSAMVGAAACSGEAQEDVEAVAQTHEPLSLQSSTTYHALVANGTVQASGVDPLAGGATMCLSDYGVLVGIDQQPGLSNTKVIACRAINTMAGYSLGAVVADNLVIQQTPAQAGAGRQRMYRCPANTIATGWKFSTTFSNNKPRCRQMFISGGPWNAAAERHEGDVDSNYYILPSAYTYDDPDVAGGAQQYSIHLCKNNWIGAGQEGAMVGGFQNWSDSQPLADMRYRCAN